MPGKVIALPRTSEKSKYVLAFIGAALLYLTASSFAHAYEVMQRLPNLGFWNMPLPPLLADLLRGNFGFRGANVTWALGFLALGVAFVVQAFRLHRRPFLRTEIDTAGGHVRVMRGKTTLASVKLTDAGPIRLQEEIRETTRKRKKQHGGYQKITSQLRIFKVRLTGLSEELYWSSNGGAAKRMASKMARLCGKELSA